MKPHDLESMSMDELWSLHEFVASVLARKISADLHGVPHDVKKESRARRPYPQALPKYRNPAEPSETWSGRGKRPRWLTAQLRSGKRLDGYLISAAV